MFVENDTDDYSEKQSNYFAIFEMENSFFYLVLMGQDKCFKTIFAKALDSTSVIGMISMSIRMRAVCVCVQSILVVSDSEVD